jgi:non-heme chloroperoxidase
VFQDLVRRLSIGPLVGGAAFSLVAWSGQAALGASVPPSSSSPILAQALVGTWKGVGNALVITRAPDGKLHGELHGLDAEFYGTTASGNPISSIAIEDRHVRMDLDEWAGTLDGSLSTDGNTLSGTFTKNGSQNPFKFERLTKPTATSIDPSPHKVLLVPVDKGVRLEVLDWGGQGPALVFLAGHGKTGHVFDDFAPKFTGKHHVYAITRRGWGASSKPEPDDDNYDADRLGDDVLAVIDALKLDRPVLAGHSLAGEELSSIGTRHPEKVSGLIYLDAIYGYAFYGPYPSFEVDLAVMHRDALELMNATPAQSRSLAQEMQATIPKLETTLQRMAVREPRVSDPPPASGLKLRDRVDRYIWMGERRYTGIKGPVLAIVATPKACSANCDAPGVKTAAAEEATQADAFAAGTPQARVVRIANANHFVFWSNPDDVAKEMNAFMDGLHAPGQHR